MAFWVVPLDADGIAHPKRKRHANKRNFLDERAECSALAAQFVSETVNGILDKLLHRTKIPPLFSLLHCNTACQFTLPEFDALAVVVAAVAPRALTVRVVAVPTMFGGTKNEGVDAPKV